MADNSEDKILINVGLNAEEAEAGIQQLGQKINAVSQQDLGTTNVKSYKLAIRELTAELQKIEQVQGRNSQAFRDGAAELGRLKLAARDFRTQIEAYDPSNKLAGIANIAKGAAVGMTGAAGAMALFGIKGEKAEEVMLRLQGILALSHALGSIHQITEGYRSFVNMLGIGQQAAQALATKTEAQAATTITAANAQQAAAERLSAAQIAAAEATAEAEAAYIAVKASDLDATVGLTGAEQAYLETAAAKATALAELTAAQLAYDEAQAAGVATSTAAAEGNIAEAASQGTLAVAEEGTAVASIGLKAALWSIGIGILISAVAYLVSNWKELKESITDLFPVIGKTKGVFKDFENDILGVGSVVIHILKSPIDEAITAIKILIDLLKGDFKQASADFKDGIKQQIADWNIVANFKSGVAKGEAKDAAEANKKRVQLEIEANERIIKERKALGKDVYALEIKNQQLKNSILDKDADDYQKKKLDGESEITVLQNAEIKKRNDAAEKLRKEAAAKAAAIRKQDLDKLKSGNEEASKVIQEGIRSEREIALADAEFKYKKLIDIAKKYHQDSKTLVEAQKIEEARINKKYDDEIFAYLEKLDDDSLSEFDKKRKEIQRAAEAISKNATPEQQALINRSTTYSLAKVAKEEASSNKADDANNDLLAAENNNRAKADGTDSLQTKYNKEQAIRDARLLKLKADYDKEQVLAAGNAEKLKNIEAQYQKDKGDIDEENAKARIELSRAEKEAKLNDLDAVGNALGAFAGLLGKNTVAAKALGVAQATISTYIGASQVVGDPTVPFFAKPFAIAAIIATGLAQVKSILAVKVPGNTNGGNPTPGYSAPTINSTVLNQANQGVQQVQVTNQPDNKQQDLRAYVVEKDISDKQSRAQYLDRQATI